MSRSRVFIGSSTEGLGFARAIRTRLEEVAEITVWDEGLFTVGGVLIDELIRVSDRFDFAIVVLTPDDIVVSKDVQSFSPRDNAVFELGLFMGSIGRERTFIVSP